MIAKAKMNMQRKGCIAIRFRDTCEGGIIKKSIDFDEFLQNKFQHPCIQQRNKIPRIEIDVAYCT